MQLSHHRTQKDAFFKTHPQSPLPPDEQLDFVGLSYFPEDPDMQIEVQVARYPADEGAEIYIDTSDGQTQRLRRYGRFAFEVDGQVAELTIFASDSGFFLPFVDALAGLETYAGGRYLEPEALDDRNFLVDFNLAYNPFCAYSEGWSCPIPPAENRLAVPIRAGEKLFVPTARE